MLYIKALNYIKIVEEITSIKQVDTSKIAIIKQAFSLNTQSYFALNI